MMTDDAKIEARFWKSLAAERVVMLGVDGVEDGFARPMIVQIDEERSPLWFFTSSENHIVEALAQGRRAIAEDPMRTGMALASAPCQSRGARVGSLLSRFRAETGGRLALEALSYGTRRGRDRPRLGSVLWLVPRPP